MHAWNVDDLGFETDIRIKRLVRDRRTHVMYWLNIVVRACGC